MRHFALYGMSPCPHHLPDLQPSYFDLHFLFCPFFQILECFSICSDHSKALILSSLFSQSNYIPVLGFLPQYSSHCCAYVLPYASTPSDHPMAFPFFFPLLSRPSLLFLSYSLSILANSNQQIENAFYLNCMRLSSATEN